MKPAVEKVLASSNCYDMFGLEVGCDIEEGVLNKLFLKLSLVVHPDKNPGEEGATRAFQALGAAKDVLCDETKREKHLQEIRQREEEEAAKKEDLQKEYTTVSSTERSGWMYATFDFLKEEKRRAAEAVARKKAQEEEWARINQKRSEEEAAARVFKHQADGKQRSFLDPITSLRKPPASDSPPDSAPDSGDEAALKRKVESLQHQTDCAEKSAKKRKKDKTEKKHKKDKKQDKYAKLREERLRREAKENLRQSNVLWK